MNLKSIVAMTWSWLKSTDAIWYYRRIWLDALALTVAATAALWLLLKMLGYTSEEIFDENAAHEILQSIVLGCGVVVNALSAARNHRLARYMSLALALICYIFFFREVPVCRGDIATLCTTRALNDLSIASGSILLLLVTIYYELRHRGLVLAALHPRMSWPLAISALSLFASQVMEHFYLVPVEESLELYAYVILCLGGIWLFRQGKRHATWHVG